MKSIEKRAFAYSNLCTTCIQKDNLPCNGCCECEKRGEYNGYIQGAKEQQEIDIQKSLKWIIEHLADATGFDSCDIEQDFLEAMKGE